MRLIVKFLEVDSKGGLVILGADIQCDMPAPKPQQLNRVALRAATNVGMVRPRFSQVQNRYNN